jgi:hypothetical protein
MLGCWLLLLHAASTAVLIPKHQHLHSNCWPPLWTHCCGHGTPGQVTWLATKLCQNEQVTADRACTGYCVLMRDSGLTLQKVGSSSAK